MSKFDRLADLYEATIDWSRRLENERAFYRWLIDRVGATSLLDVACGTGHHAAMFAQWGLRVEGADLAPAMLARARQLHGEANSLRWTQRRFDQTVDLPGSFDLAICVGNSIALAEDLQTAARAVAQMLAAVRGGGAVVVQALNLWRLPNGPCRWQQCVPLESDQGAKLILKGVHRCGGRGYVELVAISPQGDPPLTGESVPFLGLRAPELAGFARSAGANCIESYGNYQRQKYQRSQSEDLIMVAIKS